MQSSRELLNNPTFTKELHTPIEFSTPDGVDYRAFRFNREHTDKDPVAVYFGFGSTPDNRPGQEYIAAYAQHLDRPFTVLQPKTMPRGFTRSDMAASNATALNHPELHKGEHINIAGLSFGAVVGYTTAEVLQDQVSHLVTVSSVGTRNGLTDYLLPSLRVLRQEKDDMTDTIESRLHDLNPFAEHSSLLGRLALRHRMARIFAEPSFLEIPDKLHTDTQWTDYIGEQDEYSNHSVHSATVDTRNERHPRSSVSVVIPEMRHMWSTRKDILAKLVDATLRLHELQSERDVAKTHSLQ